MANAKLNDAELAGRALEAFRTHGFEGTSLNRLAEATGLEKASLYYRFPGGKDEIAMAAAAHVAAWFERNIFIPLKAGGSPERRIRSVVHNLREFYGDGTKPCVLDTLSLRGGSSHLSNALRSALEQWLSAFAAVAVECGLRPDKAKLRAEQAIGNIEGSLVLARVLGDSKLFLRSLAELGSLLRQP